LFFKQVTVGWTANQAQHVTFILAFAFALEFGQL
jgi:hypothetical protein